MYWAVYVEDANGKNERCLLFTDEQIKISEKRAEKNKEDLFAVELEYRQG